MGHRAVDADDHIIPDGHTGQHHRGRANKHVVSNGHTPDLGVSQRRFGTGIMAEDVYAGGHGHPVADVYEPAVRRVQDYAFQPLEILPDMHPHGDQPFRGVLPPKAIDKFF